MSSLSLATKEEFPLLLKRQRKHIGVLRERAAYLQKRAQEVPEGPAHYHKSEIEAIEWVLNLVNQKYGVT